MVLLGSGYCQIVITLEAFRNGYELLNLRALKISTLYKNCIFRMESSGTHDMTPTKSSTIKPSASLRWRHNERDGVSNHRRQDGLLNRLFRRKSKKTSKLRVSGLCEGNPPVTGEFPAQRASSAENVSIWWRHHVFMGYGLRTVTLSHWKIVQRYVQHQILDYYLKI